MSESSGTEELPTERETWKSHIGFMMAATGSAIGLANIWKFPYVVGTNGGAAFIITYLICTFIIGFPVMISEVLLGRTTRVGPAGAFGKLGGAIWKKLGGVIVLTALLVTAFYSVVAGWILGYFVEACSGALSQFTHSGQAVAHYDGLISSPFWAPMYHVLFMGLCVFVSSRGVRGGLEIANKIMMPVLFLILIALVVKGVSLDGAERGLKFLLSPDWSSFSPAGMMVALGQSFFTLSAGQGTMITYGSYLSKKDNLLAICLPVVLADLVISILASIVVFTVVFSADMEPAAGPGLLFHTLPVVFGQLPAGWLMAILFFFLVSLAAISSEISAMEVVIAYFVDEWKMTRGRASYLTAGLGLLIGLPSAFSYSFLSDFHIWGSPIVFFMDTLCTGLLIPIGGFLALILVGWFWGFDSAYKKLEEGASGLLGRHAYLRTYLCVSIKYLSPILVILVFLRAMEWM